MVARKTIVRILITVVVLILMSTSFYVGNKYYSKVTFLQVQLDSMKARNERLNASITQLKSDYETVLNKADSLYGEIDESEKILAQKILELKNSKITVEIDPNIEDSTLLSKLRKVLQ